MITLIVVWFTRGVWLVALGGVLFGWFELGGGGLVVGARLVALLLVVEVGIVGVFESFDLVLFFVFFEIVLLPMYAVIAVWGGERRRHAARKFVLYTLFGSVLLLVGVFVVVAG